MKNRGESVEKRLAERAHLIRVSRGKAQADLYITGGQILNVFTGETIEQNIAVAGGKIAYVGSIETMVGPQTELIDARGLFVVPGYFDPHGHADIMYNPLPKFRSLLKNGGVYFLSETFDWPRATEPDLEILVKIVSAREYGKRVEAHAPGCSAVAPGRNADLNFLAALQCHVSEIHLQSLLIFSKLTNVGTDLVSVWWHRHLACVINRLEACSTRDKPCPYIFQEPRYLGKLFLKRDTRSLCRSK